MTLVYLHFDASEGSDDTGSFDAMASTHPAGLAALQAELALVLAWAHQHDPTGRGPLEEGYRWDYDLQATQERSRQETLQYDAVSGGFHRAAAASAAESVRHTMSLSVCGTAAFCAAFRERFGLDDG